mgnify:CR=1 FL=1
MKVDSRDPAPTSVDPAEAQGESSPERQASSVRAEEVPAPPRPRTPPRARRRKLSRAREEAVAGLVFVSPFVIGFLVFTLGPLIYSFYLSFTSYDVLNPPIFIGSTNYARMLTDGMLRKALSNTFIYGILYVPLSIVTALGVAMILNTGIKGLSFWRTAFYMPHLTPTVAASVLWLRILSPQNGLLNRFLALFGIRGPAWTVDADWVKPALVIMRLWDVGWIMVVYMAALKNVPTELYEAAWVDGANGRQRFRHVTLPMISGVVFFTTIMLTIFSLQIFTEAYVMFPVQGSQSRQAGPQNSALFYVYYLFQQAFAYFRMGYASALAWVLFAITLVITAIQLRGSRRLVYTEASK